jgi:3-polyprenyl-4-hydroxybenzoate decarboxylase
MNALTDLRRFLALLRAENELVEIHTEVGPRSRSRPRSIAA